MLTKVPQDAVNGWITWLWIALLAVASVAIPLITPRKYVPIDPLVSGVTFVQQNPQRRLTLQPQNPSVPAPEQTASLLSYSVFTYVDSVVMKGYRQSHIQSQELPPVPDYDHIGYLAGRAFPHLDPSIKVGKPRHIFFSLMWVYSKPDHTVSCSCSDASDPECLSVCIAGWEYLKFVTFQVLRSFSMLLGLFSMNHLLQYLESGGKDATVHPWVWILALFVGPFVGSLLFQLQLAVGTRLSVRTEGLITQLVFDYALKMRFTDDTHEARPPELETFVTSTDDESATERTERAEGTDSSNSTMSGDSEAGEGDLKGKGKDASSSGASPHKETAKSVKNFLRKPDVKRETKNLVGKLTNLVSTDLKNITAGTSLLSPLSDG